MALPKIQTPSFEVILPSTGDKLIYRPFLVKEEKILLVSKESGETNEIYNAIKQVINNCIMTEDFDIDLCSTFDLEYLFIKIRAVSVGNIVKFKVVDSDDGIEYDLEVDLNEEEIKFPDEDITKNIMLDENTGLVMKCPTPKISDKISNLTSLSDITYELVKECIDYVFDEEDTYAWTSEPKEVQDDFLEALPVESYAKIAKFFQNLPKIEHAVFYTNSEGKEKKTVFRNLNDFFMLD